MISLADISRSVVYRLKNLAKLTRSGVEYGSYQCAVSLKREINARILEKPKHGLTYYHRDRAGRIRKHVASAPLETHANFTGKMRRSLGFAVRTSDFEIGFGVNGKEPAPKIYPAIIEFGGVRIKPRNSILNGIRAQQRNFTNYYAAQIGRRLEGRGGIIVES